MATQAKVTSLEALDSFRASLIIFLTRARRSADEVRDEVRRTRLWLEHDRKIHWEGQVRSRRRTLDQAEQELYSAKLSGLRDSYTLQENAVLKAKRAVAEAEEKVRAVKHWNRDFDNRADPMVKRLENLRAFLDHDLPKAVTYLVQAQRTLEAYAEVSLAGSEPTPAPDPAAEPAAGESPQP